MDASDPHPPLDDHSLVQVSACPLSAVSVRSSSFVLLQPCLEMQRFMLGQSCALVLFLCSASLLPVCDNDGGERGR